MHLIGNTIIVCYVIFTLKYEISFSVPFKKMLTKLNRNEAPELDKIHPRVLKEMADVISSSLSVIFLKTLSEGRLPTA